MATGVSASRTHEAYVERVKAEFHSPRHDWFLETLSRSEYWRLPVEDSCLHVLDFYSNAAPNFFGMNVQQLGMGRSSICYCFLAAALLSGFAALCPPLSSHWSVNCSINAER